MSDHTYLHPILGAPRCGALLFAGSAFYIGTIDPIVRESLRNPRYQLTHWATMYKWSAMIMGSLVLGTGIAGFAAFNHSREPLWIFGSLTMLSVFPYTFGIMRPTNNELLHEDKSTGHEVEGGRRDGLLAKMKSWVRLHRVRIVIALCAATIFYLAEGESATPQKTLHIDYDVNVKA
jgi:hypothetical protein